MTKIIPLQLNPFILEFPSYLAKSTYVKSKYVCTQFYAINKWKSSTSMWSRQKLTYNFGLFVNQSVFSMWVQLKRGHTLPKICEITYLKEASLIIMNYFKMQKCNGRVKKRLDTLIKAPLFLNMEIFWKPHSILEQTS